MLRTVAILMFISLFTFSASKAHGCLWDRETKSREVEFERQYNSPGSSPTPIVDAKSELVGWAMLGAGGVLGLGALGVSVGVGIAQTRKSA